MSSFIDTKLTEFKERFVLWNKSSKTELWWKVPLTGQDEIASPKEVEEFFVQALTEYKAKIASMIKEHKREVEEPFACSNDEGYDEALDNILSKLETL